MTPILLWLLLRQPRLSYHHEFYCYRPSQPCVFNCIEGR